MTTVKAIFAGDGETPMFHLFLISGKKNQLLSTIPPPIIKKHLQRELLHLENALVVNPFSADTLLEKFAASIFKHIELYKFFYFEDSTKEELTTEYADKIIELQYNFEFGSGAVITKIHCEVVFFSANHRYMLLKKHILKSAKRITFEQFESKYLVSKLAQACFEDSAYKSDFFYELDDESFEYAIVVSHEQENELKMLVSI